MTDQLTQLRKCAEFDTVASFNKAQEVPLFDMSGFIAGTRWQHERDAKLVELLLSEVERMKNTLVDELGYRSYGLDEHEKAVAEFLRKFY